MEQYQSKGRIVNDHADKLICINTQLRRPCSKLNSFPPSAQKYIPQSLPPGIHSLCSPERLTINPRISPNIVLLHCHILDDGRQFM